MVYMFERDHIGRTIALKGAAGENYVRFGHSMNPMFTLIHPHEWERVKTIRGVTRARIKHPEKMGECWYTDQNDERYSRTGP